MESAMTDVRSADQAESWEAEADRAAAAGSRADARRLLEQVTRAAPERLEAWLKLAAMCRADNDLGAALAAVSGALRIDPLGFVPLLLKANLLEAAGRGDEAGEAYGHAIAQRPDEMPPHLAGPFERAQRLHAAYVERAEQRLAQIGRAFEPALSAAEKRRLARFSSNIVRRTRPWHSEPSHFHYPGLIEREFHDPEDFPWLAELEAAADAIRDEFQRLMASERAELVPYIQYSEDQPLRQWKGLNWNKSWTAIHLFQNGAAIEANARHCPETMRLLERIGQPRIEGRSPNAMFSLLAPRTRIPPHEGVANTRLVCHLPLIVPEGCWFRVGAETRIWEPGKAFVFDDTIEHEAANDSDQLRVVLIFDLWHPGLSPAERDAVTALMAGTTLEGESGL
jgi:ornithine lipid ester-linked acyl 2-hydroxylase